MNNPRPRRLPSDRKPQGDHRLCVWLGADSLRKLKSKLALEGISISAWMRQQIEEKIK